jgi:hypothetical protein
LLVEKLKIAIGGTFLDSMCKDGQGIITSCNIVFGISPKNAPFQTQIFNLGLETKTLSSGNFLLDCR